ncbi:hypothetical protein LguiA_006084 [Lonicera macranthoides]
MVVERGGFLLIFFLQISYQFSNASTICTFKSHFGSWYSHKSEAVLLVSCSRGVKTYDLLQKRRSNYCLSPSWCVLCKSYVESLNHLLLHCPYSYFIWNKVCAEFGFSWAIPKDGARLLMLEINSYKDKSKSRELWRCVKVASFWLLWMERNYRIFEGKVEEKEWLWLLWTERNYRIFVGFQHQAFQKLYSGRHQEQLESLDC